MTSTKANVTPANAVMNDEIAQGGVQHIAFLFRPAARQEQERSDG